MTRTSKGAGPLRWMIAGAALAGGLGAAVVAAEEAALVAQQVLSPDSALELARAVQSACRARDFQVTVAVVDRAGLPQVVLRDQLAGNFTFDVAMAKARTAAGFRQATLDLAAALPRRGELGALQHVDGVLLVGGGIPVEVEGVVVGAVAVSGAPTPAEDHACAEAGLSALADKLM